MSGLLRRLTRRRPATADETRSPTAESSEPAGAPAETPAEPGGGHRVPEEQATQVLPVTAAQPAVAETGVIAEPAPAPVRDLPAGIDPSELAAAPAASAGRGRLRRRLRYLRRVRELLLRDLGGFVFEVQRTTGGDPQDAHRRLIESKAGRIAALDTEIRGLEGRLAEPHESTVLREAGIGGLCPECGELHGSDAHYCSSCGAPLDAEARARRDAAAAEPTTGSHTVAEPAPASVLWAAGPHPRAPGTPPADEEKSDPSAVTSQWLALPQHKAADAATPAREDEPAAATGDDNVAAVGGDEVAEEPARQGEAREPAVENGRRDEDVPAPVRDPLTSRPEQGS
jgi:hypothetical protein